MPEANEPAGYDYSTWPLEAKGRAYRPPVSGAQWCANISAGGQHDAIVCHGGTREDALGLRRYLLANLTTAAKSGGRK